MIGDKKILKLKESGLDYEVHIYPTFISYHHNGLLHRLDGPAFISFRSSRTVKNIEDILDNNTQKTLEQWYFLGKLHRGPIHTYELDTYPIYQEGPAVVLYGIQGDVSSEEFWINGKRRIDTRSVICDVPS